MAQEKIKEIKDCFDTNLAAAKSIEGSLVSKDQEECVSKIKEVSKSPQSVDLIGTRASKPKVQSRYRGNHHVASTHDFCKHGHIKRCDQDDVVKPWKIVRRRMSVEGSDAIKIDTLGSRKKPPRSVSGLIQPVTKLAAKKDTLARSFDGSSVARKKKETEGSLSDSLAVVKKVSGLRNDKSSSAMKKVSRISNAESSKLSASKDKEKVKIQTISGEDVKEKTVCVVESSVKGVQAHKNLKKQSGSEDIEANRKPEKTIKPKKAGVKATLTKQLTFKKGKVLEPKLEDSSPKCIKFRKRVVKEQKIETEGRTKNLKAIPLDVETKTDSCEGIQREKVVLRHQEVFERKKKKMTLLNNVIEETMKKFTKVRKHKVDAIIGAFETVISLQNTKTSHQKVHNKTATFTS